MEPCSRKSCLKKEDPPKLVVAQSLSEPIKNSPKDVELNVIEYTPNSIKLTTNAKERSFIASSENWDRGWSIKINNDKSTLYNTSNGLRGFIAPAGKSVVEMKYFPPLLLPGVGISLLGIGSLLLLWKTKFIERSETWITKTLNRYRQKE